MTVDADGHGLLAGGERGEHRLAGIHGFRPGVELARGDRRLLPAAHDARRDREQHVGAATGIVVGGKQRADHRDLAEAGHLHARIALLVADQAAEDRGLAIAQVHDGLGVARADAKGGLGGRAQILAEAADLQVQLHGHRIVEMNDRFHHQADADVAVFVGGAHLTGGIGDGGRAQRHAIADVDLGRLGVDDADLRIGQGLGIHVLLEEAQGNGRNRQRAGGFGRALQRPAERVRWYGRGDLVGIEIQPELVGLVAVHLKDLHLQDHFRRAAVVDLNDLFGKLDDLLGVAHHNRIQFLVDDQLLDRQERIEDGGHLLGGDGVELEGAYQVIFVLAALGLGVGRDQDSIRTDALVETLGCGEQQIQTLFERDVLGEQGNRHALHPLVEDHVDAEGAGEEFKRLLEIGLPEIEHDRRGRGQRQSFARLLRGDMVEFLERVRRLAVIRMQAQHLTEAGHGLVGLAGLAQPAAFFI